ncbi:MAG: zinc-binding dehydrogenase [Bdellovibrio sp.]|nr:zinc-binding dehydrogenase [Bdellovibrio sp.]
MKAWTVAKHGGPEVLTHVDLPDPVPGPMEALVQVEAVGLNHLDLWLRNGVPGHRFHLPMVPGGDISGKILKYGPVPDGTELLKEGTQVILNPGVSCGTCEKCLSGNDFLCPKFGILGETQHGGCADLIVVPIANLIRRPENISAAEGAALSIPFVTAWSMLHRKARIQPGETVLIQAGGSGVSVAAIQMAKQAGATVITTVGSEEKAKKARALGADFTILYKTQNFRDELKKILKVLGKKGCEVALDHVGSDTFAESLKSLAWGGRLATCGATSGSNVTLDLKVIFFKNISVLGTTMGSKADFIRIVQLVAEKKLKPVIDQTLPLSQLPKAMELLETRKVFGKVVLTNTASN